MPRLLVPRSRINYDTASPSPTFRIRAQELCPLCPPPAPPPVSAPPYPSPPGRCLDSVHAPRPIATLATPSAHVTAGVDVPPSQRPRPVSAHARLPRTSHTRTHLAAAPCSACPSRSTLSAHPFCSMSTPLAIPSSHALPPSSCPPPPLLASAHPLSCRHTLVLSTDGVGMNHTAIREHHIDLKSLDRIIAPGEASRINSATLEVQQRPNPPLQPIGSAAPTPGNLLEHAARPLHPRVQVDTPDLLRAALPPTDPAALATVPRGGRVLTCSGLGSACSSAFLSVFVVVYQGMPMLLAQVKTPILYLMPTIVYVVAWAVEVLANVGRASGVRDGRKRKAITLTWHPIPLVSFESGGRAEAVDRVLAKLLNRRTITYFGRLELSLALEGHAEAAEWKEAKDPAHRLPWAVCSVSPSMSRCRGPRWPTSLFP
ncbi:hypothetical protein B0H14DRAFT_2616530 [Mycena olivaceomarginata]|nr:hypothetical protein B0H14DRAFT_2616530 [Mycena olivaceomarginata]